MRRDTLASEAFAGNIRALFGGVAQLGERRVRNAKVEGSIPFSSTTMARPGQCSGLGPQASVAQWIERVPPKR
jgi:hypothetical protein